MSNFAIIMSAGLTAVNEASSNGTMISCRYFVPVYDYRIDGAIDPTNTSYSATDITTIVNAAETIPTGEIIWNNNDQLYSLATADYLISAGSMGYVAGNPSIYATAPHRILQPINLYNGTPLAAHIGGTYFVPPSGTSTKWSVYSSVTSAGLNDKTFAKSKLFNNVTYASVGQNGQSRANFVCSVKQNIGQFKFNKIGVYAVRLNANYAEVGDPFLFAQCSLPYVQIKSSFNDGGIDECLVEFQLDLHSTSANFSSLLFGTSGDYWQRRSEDGGMLTPNNVYVANTTSTDDVNLAKEFISTQYNVGINGLTSATERNISQLCLQYFDNSNVNPAAYSKKRTFLNTKKDGTFEISTSANDTAGTTLSLKGLNLLTPTSNSIGSSTSAFDEGYFKKVIYLGNGWLDNVTSVKIASSGIQVNYGDIKVYDYDETVRQSHFIGNVAQNSNNLVLRCSNQTREMYLFAGVVGDTNGVNTALNTDIIARVDAAKEIINVPWSQLDTSYAGTITDYNYGLNTDCRGGINLIAPGNNIWFAGNIYPLKPFTYEIGSQTKVLNRITVSELANYAFDEDGNIYANNIKLVDRIGIVPEEDGQGTIGSEDYKFYGIHSNDIYAYNGYTERGRTSKVGEWISVSNADVANGVNFYSDTQADLYFGTTISGFKYTKIGKLLIIKFRIALNRNSTLSSDTQINVGTLDINNILTLAHNETDVIVTDGRNHSTLLNENISGYNDVQLFSRTITNLLQFFVLGPINGSFGINREWSFNPTLVLELA